MRVLCKPLCSHPLGCDRADVHGGVSCSRKGSWDMRCSVPNACTTSLHGF